MSPSLDVPNLHPKPQYIAVSFLKLTRVVLGLASAAHEFAGHERHGGSGADQVVGVGGQADRTLAIFFAVEEELLEVAVG